MLTSSSTTKIVGMGEPASRNERKEIKGLRVLPHTGRSDARRSPRTSRPPANDLHSLDRTGSRDADRDAARDGGSTEPRPTTKTPGGCLRGGVALLGVH